jgi:hypothetical protein
MNTRLSYLLFFCFFNLTLSFAQQSKPGIDFSEKEFNFGTIRESDGTVIHDFRFTNSGKVPLIINNVNTSCGCTVPDWPKEPVMPGTSGVIRVHFDPKKLTGAFNKVISVSSNATTPVVNLVIKGVVIPIELKEEVFKYTIGDIRFETIYVAFGQIYKGKTAGDTVRVLNQSANNSATITFRSVPSHLRLRVVPEKLEPQQEGRIIIEYLTSEVKDWDYVVDRLNILINGTAVNNSRLNITAVIREDFSGLSANDLAMAARAEFDSTSYDFGTIDDNHMVEHSFKLTNSGKTNLIIRKVAASCGCTAVQPSKTTVPPGDYTEIKAVFNPAGYEGSQKKAITVITNDPRKSKFILWISGTVRKTNKEISR